MNRKRRSTVFPLTLMLLMTMMVTTACDPRLGFVESNFKLSDDSRLPQWIPKYSIPRHNLDIQILLYTGPFGNKAKVKVYDESRKHKEIWSQFGDSEWRSLSTMFGIPIAPAYNYSYTVITMNKTEEVFKTKGAGIYYVIDPELRGTLTKQSRMPRWLNKAQDRKQLSISFLFHIGGAVDITVEDPTKLRLVGQFRGKYTPKELISETSGLISIVVDGIEENFICESNEYLVLKVEEKA